MQRFHLDNKGNEIAIVHASRRVSRQGVENNQAECTRGIGMGVEVGEIFGRRMNYAGPADSEICYTP